MNTQVNINNNMVPFKGVNVCWQKIAPLPPLLLEAKSLELPVAGSNVRQHPRCGRNEGHEAPANTDPSHRMPGEALVETRRVLGREVGCGKPPCKNAEKLPVFLGVVW